MQILVSDTSVLIDIERASLTAKLFDLPFQFAVPDMLYESELLEVTGPELIERGLRVVELDTHEVEHARQLRRIKPALSLPDAFALALASARSWTLLTGDKELREEAIERQVCVHGVLWIFDRFEAFGTCSKEELRSGLETLKDHPRCRLPVPEIDVRLKQY